MHTSPRARRSRIGFVLDEQRTLGVFFDEAPERLQVLAIECRAPECRDPLEQLLRCRTVDLPQQALGDIDLGRCRARQTVAE